MRSSSTSSPLPPPTPDSWSIPGSTKHLTLQASKYRTGKLQSSISAATSSTATGTTRSSRVSPESDSLFCYSHLVFTGTSGRIVGDSSKARLLAERRGDYVQQNGSKHAARHPRRQQAGTD